jgi:hypothetical protein
VRSGLCLSGHQVSLGFGGGGGAGDQEAAVSLYERALRAIPDCLLLHVAYMELQESRWGGAEGA